MHIRELEIPLPPSSGLQSAAEFLEGLGEIVAAFPPALQAVEHSAAMDETVSYTDLTYAGAAYATDFSSPPYSPVLSQYSPRDYVPAGRESGSDVELVVNQFSDCGHQQSLETVSRASSIFSGCEVTHSPSTTPPPNGNRQYISVIMHSSNYTTVDGQNYLDATTTPRPTPVSQRGRSQRSAGAAAHPSRSLPKTEQVEQLAMQQALAEMSTTCTVLRIPPEPSSWTNSQARAWLIWTCQRNNLCHSIDFRKFDFDGAQLVRLQQEDFKRLAPICGEYLWSLFGMWRSAARIADIKPTVDNEKQQEMINNDPRLESNLINGTAGQRQIDFMPVPCLEPNRDDGAAGQRQIDFLPVPRLMRNVDEGGIGQGQYAYPATGCIPTLNYLATSPAPNVLVVPVQPVSTGSPDSCGNSYRSDRSSDCEMVNQGCGGTITMDDSMDDGRSEGSSTRLWQFLKELLSKPQVYSSAIHWVDREQGIFKIADSIRVARCWGRRKNCPAMNYDKLSRSIRQYYKKGIMKKTQRSQRLVYQFCQPYAV
ncbi:protein c-ets-2-A-like [Paramacrobiotus metropolitanus]|uniref:protein c-ets-2-A-like n=1 Tax=Paramacrobiotus metropolitanus TaxID=2943436 RepID=UPI0024464D4D|nr:protein c-ets-2-A-like [Paramacrobiotus metropolitanus]